MQFHPRAGSLLVLSAVLVGLATPRACAQSSARAELVADINQAAVPTDSDAAAENRAGAQMIGGKLVVAANDGVHGREVFLVDPATRSSQLLVDLRPGSQSSWPQQIHVTGGRLWFSADDGVHGRELYVSDGTRAGTRLVRDLWPGSTGSNPGGMIAVGKRVVFGATGAGRGIELYVSDWTRAGTGLLKEFVPGVGLDGVPQFFVADPTGPRVYFSAYTATEGRELWITDGTPAGTRLVVDLVPGRVGSSPTLVRAMGTRIAFVAQGGTLYASGGSASSTQRLHAGPVFLTSSAVVGGRLVFNAWDSTSGYEPWTTDGTPAGTRLLKDIMPGRNGSSPSVFTNAGATLAYFFTVEGASRRIWQTDGSAANTRPVVTMPFFLGVREAVFTGQTLFVHTRSSGQQPSELMSLRGTQLRRLTPASSVSVSFRASPTPLGPDRIAFFGVDRELGLEVFEASDTKLRLLADIHPPNGATQDANARVLGHLGRRLLLTAESAATRGRELWIHDPELPSTQRLASAVIPTDDGARIGNRVVFSGSTPATGHEVYVAEGTQVRLLADLVPGARGSSPRSFRRVGGRVYFAALDATERDWEIYETDGSPGGTRSFVRMPVGVGAPSDFVRVPGVGKGLLFLARGHIYRTDGTLSGTRRVGGNAMQVSQAQILTRVGERAFFRGFVIGFGTELGVTDGSDRGTAVADLVSGNTGSYPFALTEHRGKLLFLVRLSTGNFLYESDGTALGTRRVLTRAIPGVRKLVSGGSRYFYFSMPGANGVELWRSDGTDSGTRELVDIQPGPLGSFTQIQSWSGGKLYVSARTPRFGRELYRVSDGASSIPVGDSCSVRATVPALRIDDAVLGKTCTMRLRGAERGDVMVLVSGLPAQSNLFVSPGCFSEVELLAPIGTLPIAMTGTSWSARFDIPDVAALRGLTTAWQCFLVRSSPLALEASNGVHLTLGR